MKAHRNLALALLLTGTVAVGCGEAPTDSADPAKPSAGGAEPAATKVERNEDLAKLLPENYRSKPIVVANSGESPPMRIVNGGEYTGAEADIITAAATVLGTKVTFTKIGFDGLIPALKAKRSDVIASAMADYKDRQEQIDFVDYFEMGVTMIVEKGNPEGIEKITDLCGKDVAIERGTGAAIAVERQSEKCVKDGEKAVNVALFPDDNDALLQLTTGRASVITNDLPAAVHMVASAGGGSKLELVDEPLYGGIYYGFGIRKEDSELRDALQQAVQQLVDDGTYTAILEKYGIQDGALEKITVNGGKDRPFK